jgi:hypothetical protein
MKVKGVSFLVVLLLVGPLLVLPAKSQIIGSCNLKVSLLNQDPYPAVPGEYVKVVFQIKGIDSPSCGEVDFILQETSPFSLRDGVDPRIETLSGIYLNNYPSFLLAPFELLVDERAVDGENKIRVSYAGTLSGEPGVFTQKDFNITIENSKTDFEVAVKDYVPETKIITFEILNTGDSDVEALTIEIPKQQTIKIKGSNRNIVGSLDSNEDTTFSFEATPSSGLVNVRILYTDKIDVRRSLEKSVEFDPEYFEGRESDKKSKSPWFYVSLILILVFIVRWYIRRRKTKKKHSSHHR